MEATHNPIIMQYLCTPQNAVDGYYKLGIMKNNCGNLEERRIKQVASRKTEDEGQN